LTQIILINGKKRSGKDYTASVLQEELYKNKKTSETLSFAGPIKDIIAESFRISHEDLDNFKNDEESIIVRKDGMQTVLTDFRKILQNFGTEAMKKYFGDDVWVKLLLEKANKSFVDYVIVTDFRFPEEYINEAITIRIKNSDVDYSKDPHLSETSLNDFVFDHTIDNTGYRDISSDISELVNKIIKP